jgi:hypothetical protein
MHAVKSGKAGVRLLITVCTRFKMWQAKLVSGLRNRSIIDWIGVFRTIMASALHSSCMYWKFMYPVYMAQIELTRSLVAMTCSDED